MTFDVATVGHIRVMRMLARKSYLIIGLLDEEALKGYKDVTMSYEERKEILESITWADTVVRQSSLNPYENLIQYKITHVASGDGFEKEELLAIKKARCEVIDVILDGEEEGEKLFGSSVVKEKIRKHD